MAPALRTLWILTGFIAGVLAAGYQARTYAAIFAFAALIVSLRPALFLICGLIVGIFYCNIYANFLQIYRILPERNSFEAVVISDPKPYGDVYRFEAKLRPPSRGKFLIFTEKVLQYGDLVSIRGNLREKYWPLPLSIKTSSVTILASGQAGIIGQFLHQIKTTFFQPLNAGLAVNQSAFLRGLLFGDTSGFSASFKTEMRRSGTTHLVAMSGYNIALVAAAVAWLFGKFMSPSLMFYAAVIFMGAFVLMAGAEPSVLRAAIMGAMLLLARNLGRIYSFGHAVLWTAFVLVLFNPAIALAVGFQLSFAALLGIAFLPQIFQKLMRWKELRGVKSGVVTAVSAYVATVPLVAPLGGISLTAIPANIVLLPFIPLTMFLGFATGLAAVIPFVDFILLRTLGFVLSIELLIIRGFSAIPPLQIDRIPFLFIAAYYAALILAAKYFAHEPI